MPHTRHIFFSLLCISNALLSINPTNPNNNCQNKDFDIKPLYNPEIPKEIREAIKNEIAKQQSEQTKTTESTKKEKPLSDTEIEEMKLVLESSPTEAQLIINHLQDPTYFPDDKDYRSAIFFGAPGSGKTVTAKAIAYEMKKTGWECKFISSTSLFGEHRNQTAMRLTKELESIVESKKPTLIIIDELNRLLENADSKNHDTDSTSTALWTFLDEQEGNENFFLIGTMNRIDKLPQPFKSRIITDYINFPLSTDTKLKNKLVRMYLTTKNSNLDEEVTDDFLNKELEKINDCAGRCLKKISRSIGRTNIKNESKNTSVSTIKKAAITHVVDEYIKRKAAIKYDWVDETDDERQNRHHKENLNMHERHFVQQQIMQPAIINYQEAVTVGTAYSPYAQGCMNDILFLLSDEQKQLYSEMMSNTLTRKTRKIAAEQAIKKATAEEKAKQDKENSFLKKIFG